MNEISFEQWKKAFAIACAIAIKKGYFDDILEFDLFPASTEKEYLNYDQSLSREEIYDKVRKSRWEKVDKAFLEVFGYNRKELFC